MRRSILFVSALFAMLASGGVGAQDSLRIAAVVNDQIISVYDLDMRVALLTTFAGVPDNPETHQRLAPQVLRTLIDEELKRQEAARQKITASESEIRSTIERVEKSNNLHGGDLDAMLARNNIDRKALVRQVETQILWGKLVSRNFSRTIQISDEEINAVLAEIAKNKGKPEYLVSEIFLPVDRPQNDGQVLDMANRLAEQLKAGANFAALARNFSKSATADHGGDLGWNVQGQFGQYLDPVVANLSLGQTSAPVRAPDGYYLLRLRDRRTATGLDEEQKKSPIVNVQQFFLPIEKGASPADVAMATEAAKKVVEKAKTCEELDKVGKDIGSPMSGNLGDIPTNALAPQQRTLIRALPVLVPSQPLRTDDGIMVLMVCRRDEPKADAADTTNIRERITERLIGDRLELAANQLLRDLWRNAFVDIRL